VVFDLDNTLLQSRLGATAGLQVAASQISLELRKHGLPFSRLQILRKLNVIERERRAPSSGLVPRSLYDRDNWWKLLIRNLHAARIQGPWIHQTTLLYWKAYQGSSPPFPDAEATIKKLKGSGYRLAIVSDSDGTRGMKEKRVNAVPFRELFEFALVAGEDTPKVKPSRAPFRMAAKKFGLPPENCVYVGDNPLTDIQGAKAIGMTTILVKRKPYSVPIAGSDPPNPTPTFEVNALKEIPAKLAG
jgi:HAD superfamily hydrolase (TIGR01662 family)